MINTGFNGRPTSCAADVGRYKVYDHCRTNLSLSYSDLILSTRTMTSLNSVKTLSSSRSLSRWLALLSWILVASLHLTLLGFDLVRDYPRILTVCEGPLGMFGGCDQLAVSAAEVAVLASWGMSLQHYAISMLFLVVLGQLIYLSLGLLILWQQGMNRLGLTVSLALIVITFSMYSGGDEFGSIHPNLFVPGLVAGLIGPIIMATFIYLMPNGRFFPRWAYI